MAKELKQKKEQRTWAGFMQYERLGWAVLLAVVLFPLLAFVYNDVTARFGELSLFIYDSSFFRSVALKPGGFLEYVSDFMAQLLFIPWLGSLVAVLLWEAVYFLSIKAFDIPKGFSALALVPVAMLLLTVMGYGDKVNVMLYRNVFYTATVGFLYSLAVVLCSKRIANGWLRALVIAAMGAGGYLLFGAYGLLGAVLASLVQLSHGDSAATALVSIALALAVSALLPLAFDKDYLAGVPVVEFYNYDKVNVLPYLLLAAFSAVYALAFRGRREPEKAPKAGMGVFTSSLALVCAVLLSCLLWKADADYRAETAMYKAFLKHDWKTVVNLYDKVVKREDALNAKTYAKLQDKVKSLGGDERRTLYNEYYFYTYQRPSRLMSEFRMLATAFMGESGNLLFAAPQGELSPRFTPFVSQYGPTIYRYWGLFNNSYVWTTATSIHGGWSYYNLKEAALSMILAGNLTDADKYLDILENTLFYAKWAREQRKYFTDAQKLREDFYQPLGLVCPREDTFYSENGEIELKIMEHFALAEQPETSDMTAGYTQCSMIWAMLSKDPDAFWRSLDNYYGVNMPATLPRYYQQAAYLFSVLNNDTLADRLPIDDEVRRQYDAFATYMTTHQGSVTELRNESYKRFGKTYFYFYFFVDNYI